MTLVDPRRPAPRSLDDVRDPDGDSSYPVDVLAGASSGLVLFAARWYGRQDAYHFARARVPTTCVDIDGDRLRAMYRVYPSDWTFYVEDVFDFAAEEIQARTWDVVSLDPFTQDFDRCASLIDLWAALANQTVVIGSGATTPMVVPQGWRFVERRKRSEFNGGVYWDVLARE